MKSLQNFDQISIGLLIKYNVKPTDELIGKLNYFLLLADHRYNSDIGSREQYIYWCGEKCLRGILKRDKRENNKIKFIPFSEVDLGKRIRLINAFIENVPDKQFTGDKILQTKELRCKILSNKRLTDREKECIIGRYFDNLKIKDLGDNGYSYIRSGLQKLKLGGELYV